MWKFINYNKLYKFKAIETKIFVIATNFTYNLNLTNQIFGH
jgi:hypothetical protein